MKYTKPIDHLPDVPDSVKSHWYIVDLDSMTREELIEFAKQFCSIDKEGRPILWLTEGKAKEMGLEEVQ